MHCQRYTLKRMFNHYYYLVDQTSLLRFTVSRRTDDLSDNIKETSKEILKSRAAFILALDENTDIGDTALLFICIRAVTVCFHDVEESFDMASLSSTITGRDI